MLSNNQLVDIRNHLESSQNPLFFFDNDSDGLCSFLLLRRFIDRGKGVPIRSFPELNASYLRKIDELNPDVVFILDKPVVSKEFLDGAKERNVRVVWIDHHNVPNPVIDNPEVHYYNPMINNNDSVSLRSSEPTTYIAWSATKKSGDEWIALIGCISDNYIPEFSGLVGEKFPDLWPSGVDDAFVGVYGTPLGKIVKIFSFSLKDKISSVVNMMRYLYSVNGPLEVLDDSAISRYFGRYKQINSKYSVLLSKALSIHSDSDGIVYFQYGGSLSISSDLANELFFNNSDKTVIVAYIAGSKANLSLRSKLNILSASEYALSTIPGATGGGHKNAVGASMPAEDVLNFKKRFTEMLNKN